jgi:ABC-type glutathione transport system ATPase component
MSKALLEYRNFGLSICAKENSTPTNLVRDVSFSVLPGKITALIGLSGSGKTLCANAPLKLWPSDFIPITAGEILFSEQNDAAINLIKASEKEIEKIRGRKIGFVFQEAAANLNPTKTIGNHLIETLIFNGEGTVEQAQQNAIAHLVSVGLSPAERFMPAFPHQLSGGQKQRVLIALALCTQPSILIADEPTSSLDSVNQRDVLHVLKALSTKRGLGILFITHNINLVEHYADYIAILENGRLAESGDVAKILKGPKSHAGKQLIENRISGSNSVSLKRTASETNASIQNNTLLETKQLSVSFVQSLNTFDTHAPQIKALNNVSIKLRLGITTGIAGESGSGKSTLVRCLAGLIEPQKGQVHCEGKSLSGFSNEDWRTFRKRVQIVFQDSYLSLNPLMRVDHSLLEAIRFHNPGLTKAGRIGLLINLLDRVHLSLNIVKRRPHQLSGGQRQRCNIVRALASNPEILLFDEAVSALDTVTQFQILNLIAELKKEKARAIAFVSHDIDVIRYLCDEIAVMHEGRVVEFGEVQTVFEAPQSEYTCQLVSSGFNAIA